jgi:hypothetical protein
MTPKQKAIELAMKFDKLGETDNAKQCALIAVDEIINTDCLIDEDVYVMTPSYIQYWQEVNQEINNL